MPGMDDFSVGGASGVGGGNGTNYTWHLSLRLDRPVEGCTVRPHAYMYSKKIDERNNNAGEENNFNSNSKLPPHSRRSTRPPPPHEFIYRWFRGPPVEVCANELCTRRTSFNPVDWTRYSLQGGLRAMRDRENPCLSLGSDHSTLTTNIICTVQCVSSRCSLNRQIFCTAKCFVEAWRQQQQQQEPVIGNGTITLSPKTFGSIHRFNSTASNASGAGWERANSGDASNGPFSDDASVASMGSNYGNIVPQQPQPPTTPGSSSGYAGYGASTPLGASNYDGSDMPGNRSRSGSFSGNNPYSDELDGLGGVEGEWVEISRNAFYVPTELDMGRKLSLEATAVSHAGKTLMQRIVKSDIVLSRPPDPIKRNLLTAGTAGKSTNVGARFRMVTYNVLSEIYATQQQYPYCDFWALSSEYRFQNILREILNVNPDVVCLQEVQADHYENFVYNAFSEAGFEGVYKSKTRAAMGMVGKVDGCALFWRRPKFHLIESYSIEMNELAQRHANHIGIDTRRDEGVAFLNRLSKDNVAQLVVLELANPVMPSRTNREPINQICIANTHLYSHKDFPDVKLWQTWQLLQELENFIFSKVSNLPLIICGDFNSTPDTAVYNLLMHQSVHPGHPDVNLPGDEINILPDVMSIGHSFQLGSSYATVMGEEPPFTNYTTSFKGTLDYIWYSANNLRPVAVAEIPSEEDVLLYGEGMPSAQYSSDHVMLMADMQILLRPP